MPISLPSTLSNAAYMPTEPVAPCPPSLPIACLDSDPIEIPLMGKVTGFLEYEREDRDYLPVEERIRNFKEFVLPLPEKDIREQAARCMNCGVPYCHGTNTITNMPTGCPVNNQIPDWNDLVYSGNWEEAARNQHSTNNF